MRLGVFVSDRNTAPGARVPRNTLAARVSCPANEEILELVSPLPGTTFLIDPDLPSSRRVPVQSSGTGTLVWESPTLQFDTRSGHTYAVIFGGEAPPDSPRPGDRPKARRRGSASKSLVATLKERHLTDARRMKSAQDFHHSFVPHAGFRSKQHRIFVAKFALDQLEPFAEPSQL